MELNRSNRGFSQIRDASSLVVDSLVDSGVLPSSFRVVKGHMDFAKPENKVDGIKLLLDEHTREPILLSTKEKIVYAAVVADENQSLTVELGDADAAANQEILALSGAKSATSTSVWVPAKNEQHVVIDTNTSSITTGHISVMLVIF